MGPTAYFLVVGISLASARHTPDVNTFPVRTQIDPDHNHDSRRSAQDVGRRNVEYRSDVNSNRDLSHRRAPATELDVYSDRREADYTYATESDHVALISEKVDSSNNIGNEENEFKLRTNAYPTVSIEITGYTTEPIDTARTNIEGLNDHNRRGASGGFVKEHSREPHHDIYGVSNDHRSTHNSGGDHFVKNHRSLNMDPETRLVPHGAQAGGGYDESPNTNVVQPTRYQGNAHRESVGDSNTTRQSSRGPSGTRKDERERVPKEKDEDDEVPWVWGSEPEPKVNTTDPNDLDDRAAFDGSACATGYVKVMGICVEKH